MTTQEDYENFVPPDKDILDKYKVEAVSKGPGWPQFSVDVLKRVAAGSDEQWVKVAEYERNYSMLKTFTPFQQFVDGSWHDYALISTVYTRFEVLDLESGKIIAVEDYPTVSEKVAQDSDGRLTAGQEMPGWGFCPMEFYVPNWWSEFDESFIPSMRTSPSAFTPTDGQLEEILGEFSFYEGKWAFYAGCIWGDDSSEKIRFIDLSRITEGIVTADERFGYLEIPEGLTLPQTVIPSAERGDIQIAVPVRFDLKTGKARYKEYTVENINWE